MGIEQEKDLEVIQKLANLSPQSVDFIREHAEEFALLIGMVLDPSRAEKSLVEVETLAGQMHYARESFERVLAVAKDAIVVLDQNGNVMEWSLSAEQMFGFSREEVLGQNLHKFLVVKRDLHVIEEQLARFSGSGESVVMEQLNELEARTKSGGVVPIELSVSAFETGGRWKALGIIRDLRARKKAEQRMLDLNQLVTLINGAENEAQALKMCLEYTIRIAEADGGKVFLVESADQSLTEVGRVISPLAVINAQRLSPENPDMVSVNLPVIQGGQRLAEMVLYFAEPWAYNEETKNWLKTVVAQVGGVLERLRVAKQIQQMQKMEAIGQFAGGIAHDFNNLLTVILGNLQFCVPSGSMPPGVVSTEQQSIMAEVMEAVERGAELTKNLLAFSRRQPLEKTVIDPKSFLLKETSIFRRIVGDDIVVGLNLAKAEGTIRADLTQMQQILLNLCLNSRHAMPVGGRLDIVAENVVIDRSNLPHCLNAREGEFLMISVTDTGGGIDENDLPRIFEPFFTTKAEGIGTGLGLAMVYGLITQHKGFVSVSSRKTQGTTFRLYFPIEDEAPSSTRMTTRPEMPKGDETILVVEDERAVRNMVARVLQRCGYRVVTAANPEEAKRILGEGAVKVDLILTDVMMPGQRGDRLVEDIRRTHPTLKVLYMSGNVSDAVDKISGAQIIGKPFSSHDLASEVRRVLGGQRRRR